MPLGNFTCVLITHLKDVLDVLLTYFLIKNDVIHAYKIWISVGMEDVNNDVDRSKYFCILTDKYMHRQFS